MTLPMKRNPSRHQHQDTAASALELLDRLGISVSVLAGVLGVTEGAVRQWRLGLRAMPRQRLVELVTLLVSVSATVGRLAESVKTRKDLPQLEPRLRVHIEHLSKTLRAATLRLMRFDASSAVQIGYEMDRRRRDAEAGLRLVLEHDPDGRVVSSTTHVYLNLRVQGAGMIVSHQVELRPPTPPSDARKPARKPRAAPPRTTKK